MAFSVEESIDRYVEALEEPREPDGLWHPSSLGGCDRKSLYEVNGVTKSDPLNARTKRIFRVGHIMHQFVQDAIAADPTVLRFFPEIKIDHPELGVTGHSDGLIQYVNGEWEVLEFKTIKSTAFRFKGSLPKADHVTQLRLYIKALREVGGIAAIGGTQVTIAPLGDALTRGRVVYVSKDDIQIGEFSIFWSDAADREITDKIAQLETFRQSETLPDRLPMKDGKRHYLCGYCSYQTTCWENA